MKPITLLSLLFYILLATSSCKKDCGPDITRPALSTDVLQWVEVANKNPKFKITIIDSLGKTKTDTVQGTYNLSQNNKSNLIDECYTLNYHQYKNSLALNYNNYSYGNYFVIDNYRENGFRAQLGFYPEFNEKTTLDTASINGKLYYGVYKTPSEIYDFYYTKDFGFIYIRYEKTTLELIL